MSRKRRREEAPPLPEAAAESKTLWALYALALAVRFAHLFWYRGDFWLTVPLLDDSIFESWADLLAKEGWRAPSLGAFDFNPAYPYFLAAFRAVFGRSQLVLFAFQHALGAATAPLLYLVARRAFADRGAGLAAGALAALYGPALFFESRLLGECWIFLANAAALWLLGRAAGRPWLSWGLGGLCLGVSAVFRPTALAFVPAVAVWGLWTLRAERRVLAGAAAAFAVGLWLPLLPFQVRNRLVVPQAGWGLTTSSGGVNLYLGNNPEADGLNQAPSFVRYGPGHEYQDFADEAGRRLGRPLSRAEVSSYWSAEVRRFFRERPAEAVRLLGRKAAFFWNHKEPPDNFFLAIFERFTKLGPVPLASWGLVGPLGLAGFLWSLAGERRHWLLHAYALSAFAVCLAFYVLARYRFPAAAGLIPFAGLALARLVEHARAKAWGKSAALGGLCAAAFAFSRLPLIGDEDPGVSHYSMAVIYANRGWKDKALEEYRASVEAVPTFKASWLNMGILLAELGQNAGAAEALERAAGLEADPARKELLADNAARLRGGRP
ncbi:MAG: glycosyltransferase family 39 protein [Elusimicrobia bacterium]|nr:glycosyltransferase family 39 protein [Elusimicrobiota bacterium]